MKQWEPFELILPLQGSDADCEKVEVAFTENSVTTTVRGFYDSDGICKVRYLPTMPGVCRWKVGGPVQAEGEETVEPAAENAHGPVGVRGMGFAHADGTPYAPFGGISQRVVEPCERV